MVTTQDIAGAFDGDQLAGDIISKIADFTDGKDVVLDFLTHDAIAKFGEAIGIKRNWAKLSLDEIAPMAPEGVNVVPEDESVAVLESLKVLLRRHLIDAEADGTKAPHLINDFLPKGTQFANEPCYGHLWEFQYALAVELEHGVTRGTNVTQNHPLLTGLVVLAHLAEDTLYYARLWVMETEGELFNAQLGGDVKAIHDSLEQLAKARENLNARITEKVEEAKKGNLPDQAK